MNFKELKEIIDLVTSQDSIEELEIEKSGVRLRVKRVGNHQPPMVSTTPVVSASLPPVLAAAPPKPAQIPAETENFFYIKSPIVGTFYNSPSPTSAAFVSVGDKVEKGTVVCIIEAMKLMNEIESEVSGEVVSVLVENGQPVEYGEKLFAIRSR
jgi:acetyl-CoA carboxylase biotin carboxyl carrier protein